MQLTELEPHFIQYRDKEEFRDFVVGDPSTWRERGYPSESRMTTVHYSHVVEALAEAQGVRFLCPKCFADNGGSIGTHGCEVTFEGRGALPHQGSHGEDGSPTRWNVSGTSLQDLTLTPSVLLQGGCNWHGHITNGQIQ